MAGRGIALRRGSMRPSLRLERRSEVREPVLHRGNTFFIDFPMQAKVGAALLKTPTTAIRLGY